MNKAQHVGDVRTGMRSYRSIFERCESIYWLPVPYWLKYKLLSDMVNANVTRRFNAKRLGMGTGKRRVEI